MVTPFLNARDFIFQAQNKTDLEEQKLLLQKAFDQLTTATNAVYTDLKTSADHLAKLTIRSFFRNTKQIQNYMNFLALDMQLATKFVGVYMQVLRMDIDGFHVYQSGKYDGQGVFHEFTQESVDAMGRCSPIIRNQEKDTGILKVQFNVRYILFYCQNLLRLKLLLF